MIWLITTRVVAIAKLKNLKAVTAAIDMLYDQFQSRLKIVKRTLSVVVYITSEHFHRIFLVIDAVRSIFFFTTEIPRQI